MAESTSLINLGELSKPATTLIEKISDAVGGIFRPYQTRRMAEAEADAAITKAQGEIQITALQQRALHRFLVEEGQKQENIENIARKALPFVSEEATPENVENDWIANFFDKSRLISDEEMQTLWAKVLAGEANKPGSYSKRTLNLLASMDKGDAELFKRFCSYIWHIGRLVPLILEEDHSVYKKAGITFESLQHLDSIGLIHFDPMAGFAQTFRIKPEVTTDKVDFTIAYYGKPHKVTLPRSGDQTQIAIGKATLTTPGIQLAIVAGSIPDEEFRAFILERWKEPYSIVPMSIEVQN
ncbi:MAG TPA: DUF2806 domain-containing protein [Edaphobacter sp.]|jgi:hypothetical protein|nr:DUF2806 domain-containing protein [Edaphobacter sp.]